MAYASGANQFDWRKHVQPLDVTTKEKEAWDKMRREWEKMKQWQGLPWPPDQPKKAGKRIVLTQDQIRQLLETGTVEVPLNAWETLTLAEE